MVGVCSRKGLFPFTGKDLDPSFLIELLRKKVQEYFPQRGGEEGLDVKEEGGRTFLFRGEKGRANFRKKKSDRPPFPRGKKLSFFGKIGMEKRKISTEEEGKPFFLP